MSVTKPLYSNAQQFKREHLKEGLTIGLLPMNDGLLRLIGLVAAYWGHFEFRFDRILESLLAHSNIEVPGWQHRGFKKRKELLFAAADSVFSHDKPHIVTALKAVCATAADLHWRRNAVVHGAYAVTLEPHSDAGAFRAESFHKGKAVTIALDEPTLEKMWHDIAHLNGALKQAAELGMRVDGFFPTLPDKQLLQLFADWDRLNPPNP